MVDVIPANTDEIPSQVLEETWELPFNDDCTNMELVGTLKLLYRFEPCHEKNDNLGVRPGPT